MKNKNTLIEILQDHALNRKDDLLYRYIEDENSEPITMSFSQVDEKARSIAATLLQSCKKGDRALMLYPAGLEFITAFYACLYAGIIAVPAYPPRKNQKLNRLKSMISDAEAAIVLTTEKSAAVGKPLFESDENLVALPWLITDGEALLPAQDIDVKISGEDIAFLQYTSGSTGDPKGVMVNHANIMSNMDVFYTSFGHNDKSIGMSWLPHFHDMGLIGGVMQPLYGGFEVTLMAPAYFLQKPIRWLRAVSEYKVTSTGGPNFAYDVCVDNINEEDLVGLDLSSWVVAPNGAEPIHMNTLKNFSEKFGKYGFEHKNHYPCYGMAETTLMVTGAEFDKEPLALNVNKKKLQEGIIVDENESDETQSLVSSGHAWLDHELRLVDPNTFNTVEENRVAEVWISGKSVTQGYWKNPEKTEETFHAYTKDTKEGPFLRTGDLAFLHQGELFICGRAKDLLIIRGRNYYPQDIEETASASHEALMYNSCAAFSTTIDNQEQLILVQEVKRTHIRKIDPDEIFAEIKKSVSQNIEVQLHDIVLVRPGQVLKTSSGKIQRQANKTAYEAGEFTALASVETQKKEEMTLVQPTVFSCDIYQTLDADKSKAYVEKSIKEAVACLLEINVSKLKTDQDLLTLGLDSLTIAQFVAHIECSYSLDIEFETLFEIDSLDALIVLIQTKLESGVVATNTALVTIEKDVVNAHAPFNLNEIQQAYLLGRGADMVLGNTSCYAYTEIESTTIDLARLEKAWNQLIQRHDMLRCVISDDFTQKVLDKTPPHMLNETDLSDLDELEAEHFLLARREELTTMVLDPSQWPMILIEAFHLANGKKRIMIYIDMLICDASSIYILLNDLKTFYDTPKVVLPPLAIGFRDYTVYEDEYKKSEQFNTSLEYWRGRLETLPNGPELPLAIAPESIKKAKFSRRHFRLSAEKWNLVQDRAKSLRITPTVMLLSLFSRVLATWSNSPHFCVNLTLFNRMPVHEQINNVVGDFTSLIPLEINAKAEKSLETLFKEVQKQLFRDIEYKEVSGVRVLRELRSIGEEHIMPVVFTSTLGLKGLDTSWLGKQVFSISQTPQVWLDNQVSEVNGDLVINWDCIDELFEESMLTEMFNAYTGLIEKLVDSDTILSSQTLSLLPQVQEYQRDLYNQTQTKLPTLNIATVCMQKALEHADKEAIKTSKQSLSYQELHNASAQLASYLQDKGANTQEHVAIFLNKGAEQVLAVMGTAYAGVPYLPIATDLPQSRIDFLLKEAKVKIIFSDEENMAKLSLPEHIKAVDINSVMDFNKTMPAFDIKVDDKALAYTIFTSGSTGKPKGVMISNESVCNTIMDINQGYKINEKDRIFAISALNFDLSVFDIYGAFTTGATLVIPDEEERKDASAWLKWAVDENITVWNSVPAIVKLLCDEALYNETRLPDSLRLVLMSGDFISPQLTQELESVTSSCEMVSLGGATEGSIWSIYYPITHSSVEKIPYGYPLANQQMHILDSALQAKPNFVQGDIYIQGKGVALGYLNDEERTQEQFIPTDSGVLYKTGDIGFFNPKGYIEIAGRIDDQVKIHGYRVELGEIETQLLAQKGISEAIVLAKEDTHGHKVLVAYVVSDHDICLVELKEDLLEVLPEYMVPNAILLLESVPLTANAKIDKKALLSLEVELEHTHDYVGPRDEVERQLATVFETVLKRERVGIYDNFFEMGGDSLLATQLASRLRKELSLELPLKDLFVHATIESLREYIKHHQAQASLIDIKKATQDERAELSFAQEGLWFIDQLEENNISYNLPMGMNIRGKVSLSRVEKAFNIIISRHETLRTVFPSQDGEVKQVILDALDFKVTLHDLSDMDSMQKAYDKAQVLAKKEAKTPFDLAKGPLLRVSLMKLLEEEYILILNMHHIISDGWSIGILFKEFDYIMSSLAKEEEVQLPALSLNYVDYSVWQRKRSAEGALEKDIQYWEKELIPYPSKLNVSKLARETKSADKQSVKTISKAIDDKVLAKLELLRKENNWTLNQILLAMYSALIYRYTNQDSMVIAVPNANRPTSETEEIIGFFVNTMLIKVELNFSNSYEDIINQVKEKLLLANEHQEAPFQSIVEKVRSVDKNIDDSFQFSFNPLPMAALASDEDKEFNYEVFDIGLENTTNLVVLTLDFTDGKTDIQFVYKNSLLADEKVEAFLNDYHHLIEAFCEDSEDLVMLAPLFNEEIIKKSAYAKEEIKGVYPFTQVQTDMYLQGQVHFENKYIIGWSYAVEEDLNVEVLKESIAQVFTHADTINLRYAQHDGQSYQIVLNTPVTDGVVEVQREAGADLEMLIYKSAQEAIDLDKGAPVKAIFVYEGKTLTHVAYMGHHAVMDGMSLATLKTLVDKEYKHFIQEKTFTETEPNTAIKDIKRLIQKYDASQKLHWKEPLSKVGNLPVFNAANLGAQQIDELLLDKEILKALNAIKKTHKVSLFALMNALYFSVLYRMYNFTEDIVLFETMSVRKSLKDMSLGMYVDIRPLIVKAQWFNEELSIIDLAQNIHEYQQTTTVPLSMQDQAKLIQGGEVVLGVNFVPQLKEKKIKAIDFIPENELQFSIFAGSPYTLRFTYPKNVFAGLDIREKFLLSVKSLMDDEATHVLEMNFLDKDEEQELLNQFGEDKCTYETKTCIHQNFEKQVKLHANNTALVYEGECLSYEELNAKANRLAHYLIQEGVRADDLVGISMERSFEMIIGLLAILKAGGAYLPIDPSSPEDRISYILEDSKTKLLLTQASLTQNFAETQAKVIGIDSLDLSASSAENPHVKVDVNNMAYVIYTSGSTGKPKGVILEHANVDRLFQASQEEFNFTEKDSWTLFHSFAFDFSVWEIWGALLHGGKLHVLSYEMTRSGEGFYNYLVDEKVTILNQTPAAFNQLIHIDAASDRRLNDLRKVIFGGEKLDFNILSPWYEKYDEKSPELVNMYGITETTVHVTYHTITKADIAKGQSLIGKAYDDLNAYVLDVNNKLVPKGLPGELHISGAGLARGYLFQEELTDEKFIKNPFGAGKLYKTGDLVRFLDDGSLEYLGRTDDQVKVRGFRIELGEIEHQLLNMQEIDEAVVLVKHDQNANAYLMAYFTTVGNADLEFNVIKTALSQHLPDYMVPTSLLQLETMPLTSNGKIDKKALVKIDVSMDSSQEYVEPRDETEETLVRLFAQILNVAQIGIYDNFFELGGNSLLSVQLVALIKAEGLSVEVKDIFQAQTVAELSAIMKDDTVEEPLDLDAEAFLEADIKALDKDLVETTSKDVLLTGATGFVGRYLLEELLETSDVNVYCAVRASSKEEGMQRIKKSLNEFGLWKDSYEKRVFAVCSDLAKAKLGIQENEYEELSKRIDKVYHSATYMNHLATYEFLKEVNIGGLKELLRFVSKQRNKSLEYVSTIELLNDEKQEAFDEEINLHDQKHFKANGYASTKFVAEEICLVAQKRGIEINIYRLGLITGDTKRGKNDSSQWFGQLLEANMTLGVLFHAQGFNIPITPVSFVSKSIVALATSEDKNRIYHITNDDSVKLGQMLEMYNDGQEKLKEVSLYEFIQMLKAYNEENEPLAITTFLMKYLEMSKEELDFLQETDVKQKMIKTEKTLESLKALDVVFPAIDKTLITKYFDSALG